MPSREPREDPALILRRHGGVMTLAALLEWTTRHSVRSALAAGCIVRRVRGEYGLPGLPDAQLAAVRARGVVSHTTAASAWGMSLVEVPRYVHLTVPHGARPAAQEGVRLHWSTSMADQGGCTPPLRTVLDCATVLPFREALAVADSALGLSFFSQAALVEAALRTRGPGRAKRLRVARSADRRADNPFESCLRAVVLDAGLPGFEPQLPVVTGRHVRHVDLGHPAHRIALEADSYAHHGSRADLVRDCERYDELVSSGWRVLRFSYEHVMARRDWVADIIHRVYAAQVPAGRPGRGPPPGQVRGGSCSSGPRPSSGCRAGGSRAGPRT